MEWACELLICDERVHFRLLWRPSLERIQSQQAPHKVDKSNPIVHFCMGLDHRIIIEFQGFLSPRSISTGFMFFRGIAYCRMISGKVVA